jgi:hypothetical protein
MKLFFLQNPVNSGIFSMKNPLCRLKSYFPGQKLEKVPPPSPPKKTFYAFKKERGICDKIFCFKEIVSWFGDFSPKRNTVENFKEAKGLKGRWYHATVMVFSPCCPWPVEPFPISRLGRIACHVVV